MCYNTTMSIKHGKERAGKMAKTMQAIFKVHACRELVCVCACVCMCKMVQAWVKYELDQSTRGCYNGLALTHVYV